MEAKYKKLWPPSFGRFVGPIEGAVRAFVVNPTKNSIYHCPAAHLVSIIHSLKVGFYSHFPMFRFLVARRNFELNKIFDNRKNWF